jgi:predicted membrane channel-forming protein YqfA (hemolysin III family)
VNFIACLVSILIVLGWSHGLAASTLAPYLLIKNTKRELLSFVIGNAWMLGASSLYHLLPVSPKLELWFQRVDHLGIFAM